MVMLCFMEFSFERFCTFGHRRLMRTAMAGFDSNRSRALELF
jgi:hypothetical protein